MGEGGTVNMFFLIAFLFVSIAFLLFPKRIQQFYLDFYRRHGYSDENLLLRWMGSSLYIVVLRIIGCLTFLFFMLMVIARTENFHAKLTP
jgi:hypothetical protein